MPDYFAIPTLAGQAAIADAIAGVAPLTIASLVVGDGGGVAVTPLETQTSLVQLRATIAASLVERDEDDPTRVNVDAIIDENTGGWTIREAGLLDDDGVLLFVASIPPTEKKTLAMGVFDVLTLGLILVVSETAEVELSIGDTSYVTPGQLAAALEAHRVFIAQPLRPYFVAVDSATVSAPPPSPTLGDTYLVPVGATGAWSVKTGQLAQWRGSEKGWNYVSCPTMTTVAAADSGTFLRKTATVWRALMASLAEHKAGSATDLFTNPAGVKAMLNDVVSRGRLLHFGQ